MKTKIWIIALMLLTLNNGKNAQAQQWILMEEDSICDAGWSSIYRIYNLHDTVYVGGAIQHYGPLSDSLWHIGFYANGAWNNMSNGLFNSTGAKAIIKYKGYLYVGGNQIDVLTGSPAYPTPGWNVPLTENASRWNFAAHQFEWIPNSYGEIVDDVYDFTIYHDTLIICGYCGILDGASVFAQTVAAYDGNDFINIGGIPDYPALAVETYNDEIYIGGTWPSIKKYIGGTGFSNYAAWPAAAYVNDYVWDLEVDTFNNFLYVAGNFNTIYDLNMNAFPNTGVARYDGYEWEGIGQLCTGGAAISVGLYHNEVYAGFFLDTLCGNVLNYIGKWDDVNNTWLPLGKGLNALVRDMLEVNDTLWIGGDFSEVDSLPNGPIARWYAPQVGCNYIKARVQCLEDTFKINNLQPTVEVQFYNNNAYADGWDWDFDDGQAQIPVYTQNASHVFDTPGSYQVSVTVNHQGCTKTASKVITIINNTGTEEYSRENLQFKLYPNPTSGEVTVECTLPADKSGELRTHQVNGSWKKRYALQGGFNQIVIPENEVSSGISMVSLFVDGEFVLSEKVVRITD